MHIGKSNRGKVLNVRGLDERLVKRTKVRATELGLTLGDFVTAALSAYISERRDPRKVKAEVTEVSEIAGAPETVAAVKIERNMCPTHRKQMKDFGNKWVCEGPPEHSVLK